MLKISVSEKQVGKGNLFYLQNSVSETLKNASCSLRTFSLSDREVLEINCPEYYFEIIKAEVLDKVAEVIAIKYKYEFFKTNLKFCGLNEEEREILLVSLISADFEEDKKYTFDRIYGFNQLAIDGIFNFRLKALKQKWVDIVGYMPECFLSSQLNDFITYLLECKNKRVYIDDGKVFDSHYRRLKRCSLIGYDKLSLTRELILSNCGQIEVSGNLPQEDEKYIKKYYGGKITFSGGLFDVNS